MPTLVLKALDCERPHAGLAPDQVRIDIDRPGSATIKERTTGRIRQRSTFKREVSFSDTVAVRAFVAGLIKIGSTLTLSAATLPHEVDGVRGLHRGRHVFKEGSAEYTLWYEVIPHGLTAKDFHRRAVPARFDLRQFFSRLGRGALTVAEHDAVVGSVLAYRCAEVISIRDVMRQHGQPDGRISVREWIRSHCNLWGEESVIRLADLPEAPHPVSLLSGPQWRPVKSERSVMLAGVQLPLTGMADEDLATVHMTRDWLFEVCPSPAFSDLLSYTAKTQGVEITGSGPKAIVPKMHNEWESGSIPKEWRPRPGDFVTVFGRHVYDLGHLPMATEMHPSHTIVLERTQGAVNRMTIGMGMSGGFPGSVKAELEGELDRRWEDEFGGFPFDDIHFRLRRCWATNLKRHRLRTKLFPPVPRPSASALLDHEVLDWKMIRVTSGRLVNFLNACRSPTGLEEVSKSFDEWFPPGLERRPASAKPRVKDHANHLEIEIDLSAEDDIPVAFMAELTCRWT